MPVTTEIPASTSERPLLAVMEAAAREAGGLLRARFGAPGRVREKAPGDYVTEVDVAAEKMLEGYLAREYPSFSFRGEESARTARGGRFEWVVDPLDGTRNFVRRTPVFAVSIALANADEPVAGVIYDPMRDELFSAQSGGRAARNGDPISVTDATRVEDTVIGLDFGTRPERMTAAFGAIGNIVPQLQAVRMIGSMALGLAYLSCGRTDIYFNAGASPWDIAGGVVIARAAGATVTDLAGRPTAMPIEGVAAAAPGVHAEFLRRAAFRA